MQKNNYKFFHLIPNDGYGGVENAAKNLKYFRNDIYQYEVVYIYKNYLKDKKNILNKILKFTRNSIGFLFFLYKKNNVILICSLWKSCLLGILIKLFKKDVKVIIFLHNSKNSHILDKIITSLCLYYSNEIWADSSYTLNKRLDYLYIKKRNIKKKIISLILNKKIPLPHKIQSPKFIYWGRINNKQKNLLGALRFFRRFTLNYNNAKFIIIGKDEGIKRELEKKITEYKIDSNVQIFDFMNIEEIRNHAKNCSFYLQLSNYEGMAMSIVEAMQLGLVPIVTNVGEVNNYCTDSFNSIIYKDDEYTFNETIKLLNNKDNYLFMRKNAINKWASHKTYSKDIIANCKSFLKTNF